MAHKELLNERKCPECGQVTMTKHWQDVKFCANCGVGAQSTATDRNDHLSVGLSLSSDEVDQLIDGEEVSITRAVSNDRHLTVNLIKVPPDGHLRPP